MLGSLKINPHIPRNINLLGGKFYFSYYYFIFKFCINSSFRVLCCHPNWDCSEWGEMCQCYVKSPPVLRKVQKYVSIADPRVLGAQCRSVGGPTHLIFHGSVHSLFIFCLMQETVRRSRDMI